MFVLEAQVKGDTVGAAVDEMMINANEMFKL